jgi:hypothetical protein
VPHANLRISALAKGIVVDKVSLTAERRTWPGSPDRADIDHLIVHATALANPHRERLPGVHISSAATAGRKQGRF